METLDIAFIICLIGRQVKERDENRRLSLDGFRPDGIFSFGYITKWLIMSATKQLDATFAALADPTRRAILSRLAKGETSVMELAKPFAMSQPAISKHLKVLEKAGLISRGRDRQRRPCRIEGQPLLELNRWLEEYRAVWEANYDRLDALLKEKRSAITSD
jgi:DNA-binding transcriptional ArsR family regulator